MTRVKRGKIKTKKRERLLKHTKGYRWRRKTTARAAKQAVMKAWSYQYRDRKTRKRDKRTLWNIQINAAARLNGSKYSDLIKALKAKKIELDRKILADIAKNNPEVFSEITRFAKK